ncbi:hypothetical protein AKI39_08475 [Bordetella sp. H567]|uniref:TcpQ domain-containing protein n=1 Tax=Bordetella sp. H567 TaxID=1697043 RepID=UPI00081C7950|nr:TcpQ domain-containing protein [Bordetella sp. H567]AOB30723.1 hypothetical protein AKI39_08475 [Bordetella sp. H567]
MHRLFKTLFLLPWLSACAPPWTPGGGMGRGPQDWDTGPHAGPHAARAHDFNWRLSGDRQVAPLQVFDDGRHTWLQFAPGQVMPALFIEHNGVERPAAYVRQEPYAILQGKWSAVVMRGGSLQARADYLGAGGHVAATASPTAPATVPMPSSGTASSASAPLSAPLSSPVSMAGAAAGAAPNMRAAVFPGAGPQGRGAPQAAAGSANARLYRAGPADENMRRALARWAGLAGWTFQPEHWAVDVDIPLSGSADFSDDFKRSVRALVAATELGERPLQPCFYANQVLRVIPLSQACDRTAVRPGASI